MKHSVLAIALGSTLGLCACTHRISSSEIGDRYQVIGATGKPLGEISTIEGVVIDPREKATSENPCLRIELIDGKPSASALWLPLRAMIGDLPPMELGMRFSVEGYETGGLFGTPYEAMERSGEVFATIPYTFRTEFIVIGAHPIP